MIKTKTIQSHANDSPQKTSSDREAFGWLPNASGFKLATISEIRLVVPDIESFDRQPAE